MQAAVVSVLLMAGACGDNADRPAETKLSHHSPATTDAVQPLDDSAALTMAESIHRWIGAIAHER